MYETIEKKTATQYQEILFKEIASLIESDKRKGNFLNN